MLEFRVSYDEEVLEGPLDGRLLLMISDDDGEEPRFQISNYPDTQLIFGVDIEDLNPGEDVVVDGGVRGFPLRSVDEVPAGEYWVQALVHVYETFHRSDDYTMKMPMDRGEGQKWNKAPGNLYSTPVKVQIDLKNKVTLNIKLEQVIPPFEEPEDTKYIKYVRIESKLLTEFWGRTMHLGAVVLLPHGFDEHQEARYPLLVWHGHFKRELYAGFKEEPPEADLEPEPLKQAPRKHIKDSTGPDIPRKREYYDAPNVIAQREAYRLYNDWTSPGFPRMIVVCIQHANPYYDDSYAVNSANIGPYGDAINHELIPHIEERFRGIGEGWARTTMGGSTGGWEALATQVFYPEMYNGCWAWCPDSIDFRDLSLVNIYDDGNAYYVEGRWRRAVRPGMRTTVGEILYTVEDENHLELVKGTKGRSGGQWDVWFATYGPVNENGYVKPP